MSRAWALMVLASSFWLQPGLLAAQDAEATEATTEDVQPRPCAEGRVRVDGYCCWPAQSWDADRARCTGAPACPAELVEHGDTCAGRAEVLVPAPTEVSEVPPSLSAASGYAAAARPRQPRSMFADSTDGWPSLRNVSDVPERRALIGRGEDEGLIIAALVVFDIGWVLGLAGTMLGEIGGSCTDFSVGFGRGVSCNTWPFAAIPVIGSMISGFTGGNRRNAWGYAMGIPSIIFQGIGAIMAIIAFSNETTEIVLQPIQLTPGLSATLLPSAPGTDAGLSFGLTF